MILIAPRQSHYHHHHHHHYHDDRKYDTKFTRILYIYTHTKGSCKQSSTAVKPRNHIEAPLKNPFPTQDPSLPQPFTKLGEKQPVSTNTLITSSSSACSCSQPQLTEEERQTSPTKNPKKTRQDKTQNQEKKTRKLYKSIHKHVPLPPTSSISPQNHSKRIERQRTIKP